MQRRRLIQIIGAFFLGQAFDVSATVATAAPSQLEQTTFAAFLDILLPRDSLSGSATDLQVDQVLWKLAEDDARFRRLIGLGCQWLNTTGGPPFAELDIEQQIIVVEWMSHADWNDVPRRFYELVRQTAVEAYYSNPTTWRGMSIEKPPQPLGYPPPWE